MISAFGRERDVRKSINKKRGEKKKKHAYVFTVQLVMGPMKVTF